MKTHLRHASLALWTCLALAWPGGVSAQPPKAEWLDGAEGEKTFGKLGGDSARGFFFEVDGKAPIALESGMTVHGRGVGPASAAGLPPFRVDLGLGQRLCGRLVALGERELRIGEVAGNASDVIARGGFQSLTQRPGESLVFQDGFDTIDAKRWSITGGGELVAEPRLSGERSLRLPASGATFTHTLSEPVRAGRLELAFHDTGKVAGASWSVELLFRGASGPEPVRVDLGWSEESLAVESPNGPALAVQRLARKTGWHRLLFKFARDECEISVDENELAHGKGLDGPLVKITLVSAQTAKEVGPSEALAGHLDDLRLIRFTQSRSDVEEDVTQDEVRLNGGDQVFGKIRSADADRVWLVVDGGPVPFSWGDLSGLYFRRTSTPGAMVEGLLVRASWLSAAGGQPDDLNVLEGALVKLDAESLTLATPYSGALRIPRERLTTLTILAGRGRRWVIDPMAHHLGDEFSLTPPLLDPPQPEGGVLERAFELAEVPEAPAFLVFDVIQVVGENADVPTFSDMVKRGELRTTVKINGEPFDYLNRYVKTRNDTPERLRIPIPAALLKPGKNVIRLDQVGTANDPNYLDDLGILGIALEFSSATPPGRPAP